MGSSEPTDRDAALSESLRAALNASGVVGVWEWDIAELEGRLRQGAALLLAGDGTLAGQALDLDRSFRACIRTIRPGCPITSSTPAKAGGPFLCEYRVCHPYQGIRWLLSRGRIELGPTGHPARGYGILIDVTETRLDGDGYSRRLKIPAPIRLSGRRTIASRPGAPSISWTIRAYAT